MLIDDEEKIGLSKFAYYKIHMNKMSEKLNFLLNMHTQNLALIA